MRVNNVDEMVDVVVVGEDDGFVRNGEMIIRRGTETKKVEWTKLIYYCGPLKKNRRTSLNGTRQKSKG